MPQPLRRSVAHLSVATAQSIDASRLRPPLKWAGGKRWQLPHLVDAWRRERHRRLVEPFCGGLATTLGLMPARALLNDVNPHLINFYRQVKSGLAVTLPMSNAETRYYTYRATT
jgi:DNA adenine methylase